MKLLAAGMEGGLQEYSGGSLDLTYPVEVKSEKGELLGTVKLRIKVEGEGLETVMLLLKNGFSTPPRQFLGN